MKKLIFAGLLLVFLLAGGCGSKQTAKKQAEPKQTAAFKPTSFGTESESGPDRMISNIQPQLAAYSVKPDLSNVVNLKQFKLTAEQKEMLAKNLFVVSPTNEIQLISIYENNNYQRPEEYPSFVSTDLMLQLYHIFYDFTLREVESKKLIPVLNDLNTSMMKASQAQYQQASNAGVREAAKRNTAFFAVAASLSGSANSVPAFVKPLVDKELSLIAKHAGRADSPIMRYGLDYSQFNPRGHYTRSEALKKYFRTMMWYGLMPFALPEQKPGIKVDTTPTIQALLITKALETSKAGSIPVIKAWDKIYEPTVFYVGSTDDYNVYNYQSVAKKVYGKTPSPNQLSDNAKLTQFIGKVRKLPGPKIENYIRANIYNDGVAIPVGRQFRFMGQRFVPDSRILQELTYPKVGADGTGRGRNFPRGLDVFAAMGSERAYEILDKTFEETKYENYNAQMQKMQKEMNETPLSTWQLNLYWGWLWSLKPLTMEFGEGYPSFMQNQAWLDKSLNTSLASWAELRHDTILYAKQSVAECGGGDELPPMPKGYVEPNVEFWTRLEWLNNKSKDGLSSRGLITADVKDKFERMSDMIAMLKNISIKELQNKKLTREEYDFIRYIGGATEQLTVSMYGGTVISETDKNMAVIADIHTSFSEALEEGVGHAAEIFVVVPIEGKLYLTRGAVFTYYEFRWPSSDRLTDEKWQKMLKSNTAPAPPSWIKSFSVGQPVGGDMPTESLETGC